MVPAVPAGGPPYPEQHLRLHLLEAHLAGVPRQGAHAQNQLEGRQWPVVPCCRRLTGTRDGHGHAVGEGAGCVEQPPPPTHTHCRVQHLPYTCPISLGPRASSCCAGRSLRGALWSCLAWLVRVTGVSLCQPPPPSSFPASGGLTCSSTVHTGTGVRQALGGPCGGAAAAGEVAEC